VWSVVAAVYLISEVVVPWTTDVAVPAVRDVGFPVAVAMAAVVLAGLIVVAAEHTSNARPSTRDQHQDGQARKNQKTTDKKRQPNKKWKQNPNKNQDPNKKVK
jgi:hypothetical protein